MPGAPPLVTGPLGRGSAPSVLLRRMVGSLPVLAGGREDSSVCLRVQGLGLRVRGLGFRAQGAPPVPRAVQQGVQQGMQQAVHQSSTNTDLGLSEGQEQQLHLADVLVDCQLGRLRRRNLPTPPATPSCLCRTTALSLSRPLILSCLRYSM